MFQNCIEFPANVKLERERIEQAILETYLNYENKPAYNAFIHTVDTLEQLVDEGNLPSHFKPTPSRVRAILQKNKVYRPYRKAKSTKPVVHYTQVLDIIAQTVGGELYNTLEKVIRKLPYIQQLRFWYQYLNTHGYPQEAEGLDEIIRKIREETYRLSY